MAQRNGSPRQLARQAKLHYVSDDLPGIRRIRRGRGFTYRYESGQAVRDRRQQDRLASLAIPPAWTDVWICRDPHGHIQATGRDDRNRKQFLYHRDWQLASTLAKFGRLLELGRTLPRIRRRVSGDMGMQSLEKTRLLALIVRLLDLTGMRVGHEEYVAENGSHGLTTLRRRHLRINGTAAELRYPGKSGQRQVVLVKDRRALNMLKSLAEAETPSLFAYQAEQATRSIEPQDVNDYLREISTIEITAKDFRTWLASSLAASELYRLRAEPGERERKQHLTESIDKVARRLGNTPSVCRSAYLDPRLLEAYEEGHFPKLFRGFRPRQRKWLRREDQILLHALSKVKRRQGKST